jgi:hypothetical protein
MKVTGEGTLMYRAGTLHLEDWSMDFEGVDMDEPINGRTDVPNRAQIAVIATALVHIARRQGISLELAEIERMPERVDFEAERIAAELLRRPAKKRPWWKLWG